MKIRTIMSLVKIVCWFMVVVFVLTLFEAKGQTIWNHTEYKRIQVTVDWSKPSFESSNSEDEDRSFFSSVMFISGSYAVTQAFHIQLDIPLSHRGANDIAGVGKLDPHTTIGNMYVGGEYTFRMIRKSFKPSVGAGLRLSTMPEPNYLDNRGYLTGWLSTIDRYEAFEDDVTPVMGFASLDYSVNEVITLRGRGGVLYWFADEDTWIDNYLYVTHGLQVLFSTDQLGGSVSLTGRWDTNPDNNSFLGDNPAQLRAGLNKTFDDWIVELYLRTPTSNNLQFEKVIGVTVNRSFK